MPKEDTPNQQKTNDLKALRSSCKERMDRVSGRVREQKKSLTAIRTQLKNGARTVPEVASVTGMATNEVLWYIAAMKKFGQIAEMEKVDGYYRYSLIAATEVMNDEGEAHGRN